MASTESAAPTGFSTPQKGTRHTRWRLLEEPRFVRLLELLEGMRDSCALRGGLRLNCAGSTSLRADSAPPRRILFRSAEDRSSVGGSHSLRTLYSRPRQRKSSFPR